MQKAGTPVRPADVASQGLVGTAGAPPRGRAVAPERDPSPREAGRSGPTRKVQLRFWAGLKGKNPRRDGESVKAHKKRLLEAAIKARNAATGGSAAAR